MKLKDTFVSNPICVKFWNINVFQKIPFALQTIFSIHNLEADNFFSANYSLQTIFIKKGTPPPR